MRYWPDEDQPRELEVYNGKISVKNVNEKSTADYTLREFLVSHEGEVSSPFPAASETH